MSLLCVCDTQYNTEEHTKPCNICVGAALCKKKIASDPPLPPLSLPPPPPPEHFQHKVTSACCLFPVCLWRVAAMAAELITGAARRRRERRLRQFLRHERLSAAMAMAESTHHAAPRGQSAEEAEERAAFSFSFSSPPLLLPSTPTDGTVRQEVLVRGVTVAFPHDPRCTLAFNAEFPMKDTFKADRRCFSWFFFSDPRSRKSQRRPSQNLRKTSFLFGSTNTEGPFLRSSNCRARQKKIWPDVWVLKI